MYPIIIICYGLLAYFRMILSRIEENRDVKHDFGKHNISTYVLFIVRKHLPFIYLLIYFHVLRMCSFNVHMYVLMLMKVQETDEENAVGQKGKENSLKLHLMLLCLIIDSYDLKSQN